MKIRLAVSREKTQEVADFLAAHGIELDDESDFILSEKARHASLLPARDAESGEKAYVSADDIVFIESFGHDVYIRTGNLFALTGILVILAVVGVCLGILYRRRIRRRIREEQEALASGGQPPESRRHTRTSPETAGAAVVILSLTAGVLAVILLFLSIAVSEINASVENARLSLSNQLLEAEKQQNSLLGDIRFGPERVYGQNGRVELSIYVQSKDTQKFRATKCEPVSRSGA